MQHVLNLSGEEKNQALQLLKKFPKTGSRTGFELLRRKIGESTVTLYKSGKLLIQGKDCERARKRILGEMTFYDRLVLGIDETGRGESFGSFVIAGVLARPSKMLEQRDSKKVRDLKAKRKVVEENAEAIAVFSVSSKQLFELHEKGINLNQIEVNAINALHDFFKGLGRKIETVVDGSPLRGCRKETSFLVKGDDLNPVVGAASVIAKSIRENSKDRGKRVGWGSWGQRKKKG